MNKSDNICVTFEELLYFKGNSDRKSFFFDYGDQINGKTILPELCVVFPPELSHMKAKFNLMLKAIKKKQIQSNEPNSSKIDFSEHENDKIKPKYSTTEKKNKRNESTLLSEKKNQKNLKENKRSSSESSLSSSNNKSKKKYDAKEKKSSRSSSEAKRNDSLKDKNPKSKSSSSSTSSKMKLLKKNSKFREDDEEIDFSETLDLLNTSVIKAKHDYDSEASNSSIDFPNEKSFMPEIPETDKKKGKLGLMKKFKLTNERYFYFSHYEAKEMRKALDKKTKELHLSYKITPKALVLTADDDHYKKALERFHKELKNSVKKQFNFIDMSQNVMDYHAFKKLILSVEYRTRFQDLSYLQYKHEDERTVKSLIYFFEKNRKKAEDLKKLVTERTISKIPLLKNKYSKDHLKRFMKKRKDFKILKEEGKLVCQYFAKAKYPIIESEMEKLNFFEKLDCKKMFYQSAKIASDREYNNSIIFHWKKSLQFQYENEYKQMISYSKALKSEFYYKNIFCSIILCKIAKDDFPKVDEKNEENNFLWIKLNELNKKCRMNIFGDPEKIVDYFEREKSILKKAIKRCEKFKFLVKVINYDENNEFNKIENEFPKIIKNIKKYKNEETCQYVIISFKTDEFTEILKTMKEIIMKKIQPKMTERKNYYYPRTGLGTDFKKSLSNEKFKSNDENKNKEELKKNDISEESEEEIEIDGEKIKYLDKV